MATVAFALLTAAPVWALDNYADALEVWARVLDRYVDEDGRTDFRRLAGDRADLDSFVDYLANHGPVSTPAQFDTRDAVLSYHINAYNALAMHGVIERGIPRNFDGFFKRAGFFRFRAIRVDGRETNLYDYENQVIRPLGEARVHFALNCMVRDCPRLPRTPFTAAGLEQELEALTREFFSTAKHIHVDPAKREVAVSAILDFYTEDFVASGRNQDLIGYVNRYRDDPVPGDYRVSFMDYDWTVNQQP
jgi:hypothetical protein